MVLLSIYEEPSREILDGAKRWEYRRRPPQLSPPFVVALCVKQRVVGSFLATAVLTGKPEYVVHRTIHETPHPPDSILQYFQGLTLASAIRVESPVRLDFPIPLEGSPPVQNFRYIDPPPSELGALWTHFASRLEELPQPKRWF
jgi:predicted transcriptional regulator